MVETTADKTKRADQLRKDKSFSEASRLYKEIFHEEKSSYIVRWLINCLRKSGEIDEAKTITEWALKKYPDDTYLRSEASWVYYDGVFKPTSGQDDFNAMVDAAEKTIAIDPENALLIKLISLQIIKQGKKVNNPNWIVIAKFAEMVDSSTLSEEKTKSSEGKKIMSEKEGWFINASRSYYETNQFKKAVTTAKQGLEVFPKNFFLQRTIALSTSALGDSQKAVEIMRSIVTHPRSDWYVYGELAKMELDVKNYPEAHKWVCKTLNTPQEDKFKVKNFELIAEVLFHLQKPQEAMAFLAFARSIREELGWQIPPTLLALENLFKSEIPDYENLIQNIPSDPKKLTTICRSYWVDENKATNTSPNTSERHRGKVTSFNPERNYAFIEPDDGSNSIIVYSNDLPENCAFSGAKVEYSRIPSFDKKKNRESFKAVNLRKL